MPHTAGTRSCRSFALSVIVVSLLFPLVSHGSILFVNNVKNVKSTRPCRSCLPYARTSDYSPGKSDCSNNLVRLQSMLCWLHVSWCVPGAVACICVIIVLFSVSLAMSKRYWRPKIVFSVLFSPPCELFRCLFPTPVQLFQTLACRSFSLQLLTASVLAVCWFL